MSTHLGSPGPICGGAAAPAVTSFLAQPPVTNADDGKFAASCAGGPDPSLASTDGEESTLLDRLDRRQNEVLGQLDRLNAEIEQFVLRLQAERVRSVDADRQTALSAAIEMARLTDGPQQSQSQQEADDAAPEAQDGDLMQPEVRRNGK